MSIFESVKITKEEANKESRARSHWVSVASELYTCNSEQVILRMLVVEVMTRNRPYIVRRIHAHYNSTRMRAERGELTKFINNLGGKDGVPRSTKGIGESNGEVLDKPSPKARRKKLQMVSNEHEGLT